MNLRNRVTTCYLIRHGKAASNEQCIFAGHIPYPLLPEGRKDAEDAGKRLKEKGIRLIYSSPVTRAMETAEIMAQALDLDVASREGLSDIIIPPWEGRKKEELIADRASGYAEWKERPEAFKPVHGEGLEDLQERALECMKTLFTRHYGESFAVVTHLAVARCIVLGLEHKSLAMYRKIKIPNAIPIEIRKESDHFTVDNIW